MSGDEADQLLDRFERWDSKRNRRDFIHRMERKMYRKKERYNRS